jgi:hypothetical protein
MRNVRDEHSSTCLQARTPRCERASGRDSLVGYGVTLTLLFTCSRVHQWVPTLQRTCTTFIQTKCLCVFLHISCFDASEVAPVLYGAVDLQINVFLPSALILDERSASHPGQCTAGTHWIGVWVGPRNWFLTWGREKILYLLWDKLL